MVGFYAYLESMIASGDVRVNGPLCLVIHNWGYYDGAEEGERKEDGY
jgi:hypothetical protein